MTKLNSEAESAAPVKVRAITGFLAEGKKIREGETTTVPKHVALSLIRRGRAAYANK